ncbi:MAG TPA: MFS transporter [Acidimicrobiales bacterium]|nr:MFS transporter [Acidimicrobiales bacterium]
MSAEADPPPAPRSGSPSTEPSARPVGATGPTGLAGIDGSRVRSFIGLSIGLVGPRANLAVSGVLITLYVQQRASGALAVTFALTANRLLSWLTYPVAGRLSDRTRSRVGRRTPYMAGSLILMGISTWMFTEVKGYWQLVLFIVIARQAAAVFTLTNVAVVPEVFGRSRWIKALLLTTVLGTLASLTIKGTVIATWKQSQPSTWNLPFQVAAVIMVGVGMLVLLLVREAPSAVFGAETDRRQRSRPTWDELRDILSGPNAKVLVAGSLLFWSGVGSTAYVAILFFQRVLHAGASAQTVAGLAAGLPVFLIGIALGIPLSRWLSPMQLAVGAPLVGAVLAGVQYFDTHLWQAVLLSYLGAPFIGAYIIVLAPLLLQLLPRAGGLGQRLGVLLSPFNLCSVLLAYLAALVVDATGNYRLIWLFPAATGLAHATVNCWLKYPSRTSSGPDMIGRLWDWSVAQAESLSETGIVTGLLAAPMLGVVTKEDADSAVVIDMARDILGNPYAEDSDESEDDTKSEAVEAGTGDDRAPDQSSSPGGRGPRGVTGVRQVGGGPAAGLPNGAQKSGRGPSHSADGSDASEGADGPSDPSGPSGRSDPTGPETSGTGDGPASGASAASWSNTNRGPFAPGADAGDRSGSDGGAGSHAGTGSHDSGGSGGDAGSPAATGSDAVGDAGSHAATGSDGAPGADGGAEADTTGARSPHPGTTSDDSGSGAG